MRFVSSPVVAILFFFGFAASLFAVEPIRVMSFNIRMSLADDKENAWPLRKDFLIEVVRQTPYDFIGMQEAVVDPRPEYNQVDFVVGKMPEYDSIWLSREKTPEKGEAMLLLYKKDRWEIDKDDSGTFWLSDTPEEPGSKTWPKAGCPRVVTFGRFHELAEGKRTGFSIYVYNTHYDHMSEEARQRAAVLAMDRVAARRSRTTPGVLMGDLNCGEKSPAIRYMQGDAMTLDGVVKTPPLALTDTFRAANPEAVEVGTFNSFKKPGTGKIDYIFTTPDLKTKEARILRTQRDGKYPSDHFPIDVVLLAP